MWSLPFCRGTAQQGSIGWPSSLWVVFLEDWVMLPGSLLANRLVQDQATLRGEKRCLSSFVLLSPSSPSPDTAPAHIVQSHAALPNRSVKLIILWVLGNQWIVNCTLLKQHQSFDWSIILWGMNEDKSFIHFRGSCLPPSSRHKEGTASLSVLFFVFVFWQVELNRKCIIFFCF